MKISDSVIVITGASSGIGRATALRLSKMGAYVVLVSRDSAALDALATECRTIGGSALAVPADVSDYEAVRSAADQAVRTFGRLDAWINNAAVTAFGHLDQIPMDVTRQVIETNLLGYVHGARAALPYFREQGRGTLVQVSSGIAKTGQALTSPYVVSKYGIIGLSEALRQDLVEEPGIHVCTVLPRSTDTPIFQHGANFYGRKPHPIEPVDAPERIADVIASVLQRPRPEVIVGANAKLGAIAHSIAPALTAKIIARATRSDHFEAQPADRTAGNVFETAPGPPTMRGGWNGDGGGGGRGLCSAAFAVVAVSVLAGAIVLLRRGR